MTGGWELIGGLGRGVVLCRGDFVQLVTSDVRIEMMFMSAPQGM